MSGKVWSGLGAICLVIFSVALEKNRGTLSAALTATSDFLSLSVAVPMYFMVLAALAYIGGIIFLGFYLYEYFREYPVESIGPFGVQTITIGSGRKRPVTVSAAAPVEQPPPKRTFSAGEIHVLGRTKKSDIEIGYIVNKLVDKDLVGISNNTIAGSFVF